MCRSAVPHRSNAVNQIFRGLPPPTSPRWRVDSYGVMGKRVRPQRRVNCASHRVQANSVLSTGTHCMCRHVLHRTFVPRTTVPDSLIQQTVRPRTQDHTSDWQDHYQLANAIGYCEAVGRVSGMSRHRDSPLWCGVGCR